MKKVIIAAALTLIAATAVASSGPNISFTWKEVTKQVQHYENVEITSCSSGEDQTTRGAIVGGLIGSESGNAGVGAIIGAILGDQMGEERCTTNTERRPTYSETVHVGYDVTVYIDGASYTINHR